MTPTAQTPPAEWLPRGLAALDERFAKAKAEKYTVKTLADRKFAVTNGEGGAYEVDFTATNMGVCNCPDFQSRGSLLHAILERLYKRLTSAGLAPSPEDQDGILACLDDACAALLPLAPARYGFRPGPLWEHEQAETRRQLRALVAWECEPRNARGYRPVELVDPEGKCTGCALCALMCPDVVLTIYRYDSRKVLA